MKERAALSKSLFLNDFLFKVEKTKQMEDGKLVVYSVVACILFLGVNGESPYRFFTLKVTHGDIYPLGVQQKVLLVFVTLFPCWHLGKA